MDLRGRVNRKQVRDGGGGGANLHFDEMVGSYELNIYRHRNSKIRGLEALEQYLESQGCQTAYIKDVPAPVGPGYDTIESPAKADRPYPTKPSAVPTTGPTAATSSTCSANPAHPQRPLVSL